MHLRPRARPSESSVAPLMHRYATTPNDHRRAGVRTRGDAALDDAIDLNKAVGGHPDGAWGTHRERVAEREAGSEADEGEEHSGRKTEDGR